MRLLTAGFAPLLAALLAACTIPFSYRTEEVTVAIPIAALASAFDDAAVGIPPEAIQNGLTYTRVLISYDVSTDSNLEAKVTLYVSSATTPDGSPAGDEILIDETLSPGQRVIDTVESEQLRDALNAKQSSFVVGGNAESLVGMGTVTIVMYGLVEGIYSPLQ